jgi:ATP-dependent Zn protease
MYGYTPHFTLRIGDLGNFEKNLQTLRTEGHTIKYTLKQETNYLGQAISWLFPFILLIGIWLFIMKRVSGGAGGPGGQNI